MILNISEPVIASKSSPRIKDILKIIKNKISEKYIREIYNSFENPIEGGDNGKQFSSAKKGITDDTEKALNEELRNKKQEEIDISKVTGKLKNQPTAGRVKPRPTTAKGIPLA